MGIARREITLGYETCLLGFSGRDSVDSAVFDASYLTQGGVDEVQLVTLTGSPSGGTFTLAYKDQVTAALAYNATAQTVEDALKALSRIGSTNVDVTGSAGGPYTVSFINGKGKQDIALLVGDDALTGGTAPAVAVTEVTKGDSANAGLYVLESGVVLALTADKKKVKPWDGDAATNEVQTITITGAPSGGTFTLEFEGEQTAAIAYNANAAAVAAALAALPNLDADDLTVAGGALPGTPVTVTFKGDFAGQSVQLLEANSALTGGTTPAIAVAQTTQGGDTEQIVGIFDGRREFMTNTNLSDKEIPVYNFQCSFDKAKVPVYATHSGELEAWAKENACVFKSQGNA